MSAVRRLLVVHLARAWATFHRRPMLEALLAALPEDMGAWLIDRPVTCDVTLLRAPGTFFRGVGRTDVRPCGERAHVVRPWMPLHEVVAERWPAGSGIDRRVVGAQLRRLLRKEFRQAPTIIEWIYHPRQTWTVGTLGPAKLVYECYDEYGRTPRGEPARWDPDAERRLLARADATFVTSEALRRSRRDHARRIRMLRNGVPDFFLESEAGGADPIDAVPRPRIGCLGTVRSLLEFEMLEALFRSRPEWQLVFLGPVHASARIHGLRRMPNVHFLGARPHRELPGVVRRLDVGLVPIEDNDFTRASSPMRLVEYAACGVPVVATPLPENGRLGPDVRIAPPQPEAFAHAIESALAEPREEIAARLRTRAAAWRWSEVVRQDVLPVIEEILA